MFVDRRAEESASRKGGRTKEIAAAVRVRPGAAHARARGGPAPHRLHATTKSTALGPSTKKEPVGKSIDRSIDRPKGSVGRPHKIDRPIDRPSRAAGLSISSGRRRVAAAAAVHRVQRLHAQLLALSFFRGEGGGSKGGVSDLEQATRRRALPSNYERRRPWSKPRAHDHITRVARDGGFFFLFLAGAGGGGGVAAPPPRHLSFSARISCTRARIGAPHSPFVTREE